MSYLDRYPEAPRTYRVQARDRGPLLEWLIQALSACGCRIIHASPPDRAPFRISFVLPTGERSGIVAYAFLANNKATKNRPGDEHRFQLKYGSKDGELHDLWQDPFGLYTTLLIGINLERGFFVGVDPVLHSPTKFFISIEFKERQIREAEQAGWHAWERDRRASDDPIEILVGGDEQSFLRYVLFEREALGEDQGHRHLIAEKSAHLVDSILVQSSIVPVAGRSPSAQRVHALALEFDMTEAQVLDLIAGTPYVKKAVRGSVAEEQLVRVLEKIPGATDAHRVSGEGEVDVLVKVDGGNLIRIQCKNVLHKTTKSGLVRVDFQRTRAAKSDPCSRYYSPTDFDVVAACLHSVTERWEFSFALANRLDVHPRCSGKLASNVQIDDRWSPDARSIFKQVC